MSERIILILVLVGLLVSAALLLASRGPNQVPAIQGGAAIGLGKSEPAEHVIDFDQLLERVWAKLAPDQEKIKSVQELRKRIEQTLKELKEEGFLPPGEIDTAALVDQLVKALQQQGKWKGK